MGGLHAFTHTWKNRTEHAMLAILSALSPRSEEVKGDAGATLSNVGGVWRDDFLNLYAPPITILETLFAEMGGIIFFGVGCAAADF